MNPHGSGALGSATEHEKTDQTEHDGAGGNQASAPSSYACAGARVEVAPGHYRKPLTTSDIFVCTLVYLVVSAWPRGSARCGLMPPTASGACLTTLRLNAAKRVSQGPRGAVWLPQERARPATSRFYWGLGDVVMPPACDATWVAERIAQEAARQLRAKTHS